ncbi:hypothetical protein EAF04_004356 [Stromatinia cepivora]|nr:hypothetical protein EAF04_004356 [Stromatinia cepivora]
MISTPPIVMTSIDQCLEFKNDNNNNFDFDKYFVDININILFEGFYSYIEFFNKKNIQLEKEESLNIIKSFISNVFNLIIKVFSDLSTKIFSKLFVSMYPIIIRIVDSKDVYESKSFLNLLEAPISRILNKTIYKSVLVLKDSETSEMIDDEAIVSKPSKVEIMSGIICESEFLSKDPETSEIVDDEVIASKSSEVEIMNGIICKLEPPLKGSKTSEIVDDEILVSKSSKIKIKQSIIYTQYSLDPVIIDLTESSDKELAPLMIIGKIQKDQKSSIILLSKKCKHSEISNSISIFESQNNISLINQCIKQKTLFRKYFSDENIFLSSLIEDIEELFKENK